MTGFHEVPSEQMKRWRAYGQAHNLDLYELATLAIEKMLAEEEKKEDENK